MDILDVETNINTPLPDSLRAWLETAGYGTINEVLNFSSGWFSVIDRGELKNHIIFAQDDLGCFYSFSPNAGTIHFIGRSAHEFAYLAKDFKEFLEEFERRSFQLHEWIDSIKVQHYDWSY